MTCPNETNGIYYFDYRNLSNTADQGEADRRTYCLTKGSVFKSKPMKNKVVETSKINSRAKTTYVPQMQS